MLSLVCGLCTICHGLLALSFGVVGRLGSVIVAIPRHLHYFASSESIHSPERVRTTTVWGIHVTK